jgi:hypothetical protein
LLLCGCLGNRWYGAFAGTSTVKANVNRSASYAHSDSPEAKNDDVSLEREGKAAFLTFRGCRLRMDLQDATHATVSDGQACALVVDGYHTRMKMKGSAAFEANDTFSAKVSGVPTEAGITGEYVWKFQGARKP